MPAVRCVHWVGIHPYLGMAMRVARCVTEASTQTPEGAAPAKNVQRDRTKTQQGNLIVLPVNLGRMQARMEKLPNASVVEQGPTRQTMVPKQDAQPVKLENIKTRRHRPHALTAILASTTRL